METVKRVYNKNVQVTKSDNDKYNLEKAVDYMRSKLGYGSKRGLYNKVQALGIELYKNGKYSYIKKSDLDRICKISSLSELVLNN